MAKFSDLPAGCRYSVYQSPILLPSRSITDSKAGCLYLSLCRIGVLLSLLNIHVYGPRVLRVTTISFRIVQIRKYLFTVLQEENVKQYISSIKKTKSSLAF